MLCSTSCRCFGQQHVRFMCKTSVSVCLIQRSSPSRQLRFERDDVISRRQCDDVRATTHIEELSCELETSPPRRSRGERDQRELCEFRLRRVGKRLRSQLFRQAARFGRCFFCSNPRSQGTSKPGAHRRAYKHVRPIRPAFFPVCKIFRSVSRRVGPRRRCAPRASGATHAQQNGWTTASPDVRSRCGGSSTRRGASCLPGRDRACRRPRRRRRGRCRRGARLPALR